MANPSVGPPPYVASAPEEDKQHHSPMYPHVHHESGGPHPNMSGAAPYPTQPQPHIHVHHGQSQQQQPYVYVADPAYGPRPVNVTCPHCGHQVITQVRYTPGLLTWLICAGCVIFGCVLGCCLICIDDCQDAEHVCPQCHSFLGQHKRI
ncbi:Lipopolysaccharide-induced tumor necrosis factor-alpha factor-like protein [Aphelenchoides besseyi]|nr:Lipopolysaccharide-induced tumor necrosis factor-alpha factor-like protein [Aphelenchoides besseyi]